MQPLASIPPRVFHFRNREFTFSGDTPALMGILNVTPDSFSDGGTHWTPAAAADHARQLLAAGADFLDIGGESTRPGFTPVPEAEELERVVPVIRLLREFTAVPISVDTTKPAVAAAALAAGADIVNDVSALRDPEMAAVLREFSAGCILMDDRPLAPESAALPSVCDYLCERLAQAVIETGLDHSFFVLDPGIGFGKSLSQNLDLIANIGKLRVSGCAVLLGMSRKSFIGKITGEENPVRRDAGTIAAALFSSAGTDILRVHDVAGIRQAFQVYDALSSSFHPLR